jgi:hypothetical protein
MFWHSSTCWDRLYLLVYKASGEKLQEEVFKTPIEKQQHY